MSIHIFNRLKENVSMQHLLVCLCVRLLAPFWKNQTFKDDCVAIWSIYVLHTDTFPLV